MQPSDLRTLRKQLGLSQAGFAALLRVSKTTVYLMEAGDSPIMPQTALIASIIQEPHRAEELVRAL